MHPHHSLPGIPNYTLSKFPVKLLHTAHCNIKTERGVLDERQVHFPGTALITRLNVVIRPLMR